MDNITEARPAAPNDAPHFTLTVEETAQRYEKAGVPRTIRRIQKYCARGDLDCKKVETDFGEKYFISEESITRHIAQIIDAQDAAGRAQPRPDAPERSLETDEIAKADEAAPSDAPARPDAAGRNFQNLYIQQLETRTPFCATKLSCYSNELKRQTYSRKVCNGCFHRYCAHQKNSMTINQSPQTS